MSAAEISRRRHPCPCEEGEWEEVVYSAAAGGSRTERAMLCPDCLRVYIWDESATDFSPGHAQGATGAWVSKEI
jgi:hypothetical protein